ncbi:MAG: amidohydrolase family protein [Anaerolineae bacterium]
MIIDAHIHLWNRLHGDDFGVDRQALSWGKAREGERIYYAAPPSFEDSLSTFQRALAYMDWLGIERAVVLQEFMDGKQDDYLAQVQRQAPGRFSCLALFDKHYLDDPTGAFTHAVTDLGLKGFLVKTPSPFPELCLAQLMPFWHKCAEEQLPVVLKDGSPAEVTRLLKSVPGLRLVFSHFMGCSGDQDDYRRRLEIAASWPNVTIDSGALTYLQDFPFPRAQERLHQALRVVGADKIAWGSDYPRPTLHADNSSRQQLKFITEVCSFLTNDQREMLLSGTALRVYRWD